MQKYPKKLIVYFDGACEPRNPGGYGTWGWVLKDAATGETLETGQGCDGFGTGRTNNRSEYLALGFALRHLNDSGWTGTLECRGDSQLVCYQIYGSWQCNKDHLRKLRDRCRQLLQELAPGTHRIVWVPRDQNQEADQLSQLAYEQATGKRFPERRRKKA